MLVYVIKLYMRFQHLPSNHKLKLCCVQTIAHASTSFVHDNVRRNDKRIRQIVLCRLALTVTK